jgi:3'(2'), 5'-bisphosphate nucleotidase
MIFNSTELEIAIKSLLIASKLCETIRNELDTVKTILKNDRSPVTVADYSVQAIICKNIKTMFPNDNIIAEENSNDLKKSENKAILEKVTNYVNLFVPNTTPWEVCSWIDFSSNNPTDRFWALDPIDGTKGFLRGDQYAIALALIEDGKVNIGLLSCPNLYLDKNSPGGKRGSLFIGIRGRGAFQMEIEGQRKESISVSKIDNIKEAIFAESFEPSHSDHIFHQRVAQKLNLYKPSIKMDSQAKYGLVARGEATFYIRVPSKPESGYKEKIWDHAAGTIIAEEAGGKVTDILGLPLDFSCGIELKKNHGILVSNGILHSYILNAINKL